MVDTIFILDEDLKSSKILTINGKNTFFDDLYTQDLSTGTETFEFSTNVNDIDENSFVMFLYKNKYKLFQIMDLEQEHSEGNTITTVYGEGACLELLNTVVRPVTGEYSCISFFEYLLTNTGWQIGEYSSTLTSKILNIELSKTTQVWTCIQDYMSKYGYEISTEVIYDNGHVKAKLINIYDEGELGEKTYKRFEYGRNVEGIIKKRDLYEWCTALILDTEKNVTDVTYDKDGYIKIKGSDVILATNENIDYNLGRDYIYGSYEDTNSLSPEEVVDRGVEELKRRATPHFDYECTTVLTYEEYEQINLGDTVYVIDHEFDRSNLLLEARIGKIELSFSDRNKCNCTLSNYKEVKGESLKNAIGNKIQVIKGDISNLSQEVSGVKTIALSLKEQEDKWTNAYKRVNEWCYGAITDTTTINGGLIQTNTITADHIAIGDFNNYAVIKHNATFTGSSGGTTSGIEVCNISGSEKYNNQIITNKLYDVEAGDAFRFRGKMMTTLAGTIVELVLCWRDNDGGLLSSKTASFAISEANTWMNFDNTFIVPTRPNNSAYFNIKININETQSRRAYIENMVIHRKIDGQLIVDGAIDGKVITGAQLIGGQIRGNSNFMTAPNENATDGYGFRIYSTGAMYTNNDINIEGGSSAYVVLTKDGQAKASKLVQTPMLTTGESSLVLSIKDAGISDFSRYNLIFQDREDGYSYFRPGNNAMVHLGYSGAMFNKVYSVSGIDSSSDRTVKENIEYLDTSNNARAIQSDITEEDLYNFVRDDLIMAKFNYIRQEKDYIGFIAQDILCNTDGTDNKIGQLIVNKPDDEQSPVTISDKNYIGVLAGALRKAIHKIEELENQINKD